MKLYLPSVPERWAYRAALSANNDKSYGAYFVAHVLWQQYRLRNKATRIKLPITKLRKAGFGRSYISNGLKSLEQAGLVKLTRFRNKSPDITLITEGGER